MKNKNGVSVKMSITKENGLCDEIVRLLAYRPNPDRIASYILDGVAFNPSRQKSECIEQLIKEHRSGGTIKIDGIKVVLNPFQNAVENIQKKEGDERLLTWFQMKHRRHEVKDKDTDTTTMGCWTMAIWVDE